MQAPEAVGPMFGGDPVNCCNCHGKPVCAIPSGPAPRTERAASLDDYSYLKSF
jgi:hypothetical protein